MPLLIPTLAAFLALTISAQEFGLVPGCAPTTALDPSSRPDLIEVVAQFDRTNDVVDVLHLRVSA